MAMRCVHVNGTRRGQCLPFSLGMGVSVSVGMDRKPCSFLLRTIVITSYVVLVLGTKE